MKSPFKNELKKEDKKQPVDTLWNCQQPCKDEAQSGFITLGSQYGVGFNVPVGHSGSANDGDCIPKKSFNMNAKDIC